MHIYIYIFLKISYFPLQKKFYHPPSPIFLECLCIPGKTFYEGLRYFKLRHKNLIVKVKNINGLHNQVAKI